MTTKITKTFFSLLFLAISNLIFSQSVLNQVIVLNEGSFGGPVTVGSYNPSTHVYQNFDTLQARFGSDVIIDGNFIYVAADSLLVMYDLNTKQKLFTQSIQGVRELTIWNNQLLVTRGEYATILPSYFQVYDKSNLNFIYELTTLSTDAAEVKVLNDTAYVAINGFGAVGKLAIIDLISQSLNREIDLGVDGLNPENVEVDNSTGKIYTVNALDFSDASVTTLEGNTANYSSVRFNQAAACSGSAYISGDVLFQSYGQNKLGKFSTTTTSVYDSIMINKTLYGIGIDSVNMNIYLSETDFTTYGKVYVFNFFGAIVDSFNVGVSPGTLAFDVQSTTGISENNISGKIISYPNPVNDILNFALIEKQNQTATISITDVLGREVYKNNFVANAPNHASLKDFEAGVYFLNITTDKQSLTKKIIKY